MSPDELRSTDHDIELALASEIRYLFLGEDLEERFPVHFVGGGNSSRESGSEISASLERLDSGSHLALVHRTENETAFARLLALALLPLRLLASERALRRASVEPIGRFALAPSLKSPWLVYQLRTPAARYSDSNLLAGLRREGAMGLLQKGVSIWSSCSPAVASVVVLGRKR